MIDVSPLSLSPPAPVSSNGVIGASRACFALTLGAFLDARDAAAADPGQSGAATTRQDLADDGKALPAATDPADATALAPAMLAPWMVPLIIPAPLPAAPLSLPADSTSGASAPAAIASAAPLSSTLAVPIPAPLDTGVAPAESPTALPPALPGSAAATPNPPPNASIAGTGGAAITPVVHPIVAGGTPQESGSAVLTPLTPHAVLAAAAPTAPTPAATVDSAPDTPAPPPTPTTPTPLARDASVTVSTTPQPASQVFAAAIAAANGWRDRPAARDARDATSASTLPGDPTLTLSPGIDLHRPGIVHASGTADGTALDLAQDSGLQRMIDHIETLRDDADARDTRIKLMPDALGSVDVAVRQDGDRVHVRFTAEQDATRALIAEAQPRLSELAATRGVRIGDTSVTTASGNGGGGAAPQQHPAPQPRAPNPTPASTMAERETHPDHRLA